MKKGDLEDEPKVKKKYRMRDSDIEDLILLGVGLLILSGLLLRDTKTIIKVIKEIPKMAASGPPDL